MVNVCMKIIALLTVTIFGALTFTTPPTLTKDSQNRLWVDFAVSEQTDVAVSIVDLRDSTVVRHLAAGKLGDNAPEPLVKSSLSQHIEWDSKDDLGYLVQASENFSVRVQAGMSVKLRNTVGDNPYSYNKTAASLGGEMLSGSYVGKGHIYGLAKNSDGSIFVCGSPGPIYHTHEMWPYKFIRQYNSDGVYVKTVFPFAGGMETGKVSGWGIITRADGKYVPVNASNSVPGFTNTLLGTPYAPNGILLGVDSNSNILFGTERSYLKVGTDGSLPQNDTIRSGQVGIATIKGNYFFTNEPFPSGYISGSSPLAMRYTLGTSFMTLLPDKNHALISGFYYALGSNGHMTAAPDSTFYKDGQVFKIDLRTGVATSWLQLPNVPQAKADRQIALNCDGTWASIGGTAIDESGRVYVCERFGKRIAIYDTNATLLHSIPITGADNITISKKTGAIYATVRTQLPTSVNSGTVKIYKFSSVEQGLTRLCSLTITTNIDYSTIPTFIEVSETSSATRVWVAYMSIGVKIYDDNGSSFSLFKDFFELAQNTVQGYGRLAVDRRNETVYINNAWFGMYKISNWNNPVPLLCSTTVINRPNNQKFLYGQDMAVSPHGMLYVRQATTNDGTQHSGPISRWTTDRIHAPLNWSNTDSNLLTAYVPGRPGSCTAERGLSVGADNRVVYAPVAPGAAATWSVTRFPDAGNNQQWSGDTIIKMSVPSAYTGGSGCVRVDLKGNIYVGSIMNFATPLHAEFSSDWAYKSSRGTIVKFPPNVVNGRVDATGPTGAAREYNIGVAPFSRDRGLGNCVCRSPRFDVDSYGRLFAPNAVTCEVTVMDNAGNEILRFGEYGNTDFPTSDSSRVPLLWAIGVAASNEYIYVADNGSCRMHRVQMIYKIDNYPGFSTKPVKNESPVMRKLDLSLNNSPNPFNPSNRVSITLSERSRIRLDLFDVTGRFITTIASNIYDAGSHSFVWNAKDLKGNRVSAGTYVYRLVAANQEMYSKTVLAR